MAELTISPSAKERLIRGFVNAVGMITALFVALRLADGLATDTNALMALVGIAVVLCAIAVQPRAGMVLWFVLAPFGRMFSFSMGRGVPDLGLNRLAAGFTLVVLVAQLAARRRFPPRMLPMDWAILAFMGGLLLSVPAADTGPLQGIQTAFDFLVLPLLVYWFARNLQAGRRSVQWMLVAIAIACVTMAFITAREQLTDQTVLSPVLLRQAYGLHSRKITSLFGTTVFMAMALTIPVPVMVYALSQARSLAGRVIWSSVLALNLVGILLTYVRGAWLAAASGLVAMILLSQRVRRNLLPFLLVAGLGIVAFGGFFINPQAIEERLGSEKPIEFRVDTTELSLNIVRAHPFFGVGWNSYGEVVAASGFEVRARADALPSTAAPHSIYLWVLTSAGLAGFVPFLVMLGLMFWQGIVLWRGGGGLAGRGFTAATTVAERSPPGDRDLGAVIISTLLTWVIIGATFDALVAQFGNMLFFLILGTAIGAREASLSLDQGAAA